jgi:hypothetical protein
MYICIGLGPRNAAILISVPDNLLDEVEILDWLKRNRYKPVELHWIMYSVLSVALAFLLYSLFILYGLKEKEEEKKKEE